MATTSLTLTTPINFLWDIKTLRSTVSNQHLKQTTPSACNAVRAATPRDRMTGTYKYNISVKTDCIVPDTTPCFVLPSSAAALQYTLKCRI